MSRRGTMAPDISAGLAFLYLKYKAAKVPPSFACSPTPGTASATGLGAVESTMERRAAIPGQEHLPPSLLQLSVGIEDAGDLWSDLDSARRSAAS